MPSEEWEYFCDKSYYDQWAVRDKHNKSFNAAIHVGTQAEAEFLCKRLNRLIALEAAEQERRDMRTELVEALRACIGVIVEYTEYEHSGDPWEEDARAMGEMSIDDFKQEGKLQDVIDLLLKATKEG